jgi:hypothetical protein
MGYWFIGSQDKAEHEDIWHVMGGNYARVYDVWLKYWFELRRHLSSHRFFNLLMQN